MFFSFSSCSVFFFAVDLFLVEAQMFFFFFFFFFFLDFSIPAFTVYKHSVINVGCGEDFQRQPSSPFGSALYSVSWYKGVLSQPAV